MKRNLGEIWKVKEGSKLIWKVQFPKGIMSFNTKGEAIKWQKQLQTKELFDNPNKWAYEQPENGFIPGDEYYDKVVNWLKNDAAEKVYTYNTKNTIVTRSNLKNSMYDVVVTYHKDTKGINYIFVNQCEMLI